MKKYLLVLLLLLIFPLAAAEPIESKSGELDIASFQNYRKKYDSEDAGVCSTSSTKTYEDYRAITARSSKQYKFIHEYMTVDEDSGFLYDEYGFIGVALGSYYGVIGDRYYVTLDTGIILPIIKIDEKADAHTINGCSHSSDSSVIEFVIDKDYAGENLGMSRNGYVLSGNYNNSELFNGKIEKFEKVNITDTIVFDFNLVSEITD